MRRRRQVHGNDVPGDVGRSDREFLSGFERSFHAVGESAGENDTIFLRTVIVFARADVAARAIEVNVKRFGHGLSSKESGDARKVGTGDSHSIVTLRVRGVVSQNRDGRFAVPEREGREFRIDHPLGFGTKGGVLRRGVTGGPHFAVRTENTPIGRHSLHPGHADPRMRHRDGRGDALPNRLLQAGDHLAGECAVVSTQVLRVFAFQIGFRAEVAGRGVVLMARMHGHAIDRRSSRLGEALPKRVVSFVADSDPVQIAEDDRLSGTDQNETAGSKRQFVVPFHGIVCHVIPDGRSGVDIENGDFRRFVGGISHVVRPQAENEDRESEGGDELSKRQSLQRGFEMGHLVGSIVSNDVLVRSRGMLIGTIFAKQSSSPNPEPKKCEGHSN